MTAPKKKPKVNPAVERAVAKMLREVMGPTPRGKKAATLIDKLRVLDRALKLESIKAKVTDDEDGAFFTQPADPPDDDPLEERADDEPE